MTDSIWALTEEQKREIRAAIDAAVADQPLPGGLELEQIRAAYYAAPSGRPNGGGSAYLGLQAVAHLVANRLAGQAVGDVSP